MKSKEEINRRLRKLRLRYGRQYLTKTQFRKPENCVHNHEHFPRKTGPTVEIETELAPRVSVSLVMIRPDESIRLCMYGSEDPATWNGDLCHNDDTASRCKMFRPRVSMDEAKQEFINLLADDTFVYDNYRDIAALQWVIGDRVHSQPWSFIERALLVWDKLLVRLRIKIAPALALPELPERIWDDADTENSGK